MIRFILTGLLVMPPLWTNGQCKLTVEVSNIKKPEGTVRVCVFMSKNNYLGKADYCSSIKIESIDDQEISLDLACAKYAIVVYHDINKNGILDKNFLGIPSEPYGFPRNPSTIFGPPPFEKAQEDVQKDKLIKIRL